MSEKSEVFERLLKIMDELREQCPWDKKQTMQSLRHLTIEETYELADAVLENNLDEIKRELGDLLVHIAFYSRIASEQKAFDIKDVIDSVCEKLIARHPHIYGDIKVKDDEEVKQNWEQLKLKEGKKSILEGVPNSLPSLVKAMRIQEKVKQVGFEWKEKEEVWKKIQEELSEFKEAIKINDKSKIENEFGDLLFSLVNYARFIDVNAETALEITNKKFISRFKKLEEKSKVRGKNLKEMSLEEMDSLWNEIKQSEK